MLVLLPAVLLFLMCSGSCFGFHIDEPAYSPEKRHLILILGLCFTNGSQPVDNLLVFKV